MVGKVGREGEWPMGVGRPSVEARNIQKMENSKAGLSGMSDKVQDLEEDVRAAREMGDEKRAVEAENKIAELRALTMGKEDRVIDHRRVTDSTIGMREVRDAAKVERLKELEKQVGAAYEVDRTDEVPEQRRKKAA